MRGHQEGIGALTAIMMARRSTLWFHQYAIDSRLSRQFVDKRIGQQKGAKRRIFGVFT
jgi:hypothetical protein